MLKTLTVKKLIANFTVLNPILDDDGKILVDRGDINNSYLVWEYENGLIRVNTDIARDYFFASREEIEGNGEDIFLNVEETEEEEEQDKLLLATDLLYSFLDYGFDFSCAELARELIEEY